MTGSWWLHPPVRGRESVLTGNQVVIEESTETTAARGRLDIQPHLRSLSLWAPWPLLARRLK
jgi:hypothetical protein